MAPLEVSPSNGEQGLHPANQTVGPQERNGDYYNVGMDVKFLCVCLGFSVECTVTCTVCSILLSIALV